MFAQTKKGASGDAAKGKATFEDNCAVCHNADSAEKKGGPGLKGLFKKAKLQQWQGSDGSQCSRADQRGRQRNAVVRRHAERQRTRRRDRVSEDAVIRGYLVRLPPLLRAVLDPSLRAHCSTVPSGRGFRPEFNRSC